MYRGLAAGLVLGVISSSALAQSKEPIVLRDMGSFHVGGREVVITGKPIKEVLFTPAACRPRSTPTAPIRSSRCTCSTSSRRPARARAAADVARRRTDGRHLRDDAGRPRRLAQHFIRKGWDVYNSDAVERGRSGWASPDIFKGEPVFLTKENPFERFRIGDGAGFLEQGPGQDEAAAGQPVPGRGLRQFRQAGRAALDSTPTTPIIAAYTALVDKVCPCVILFHCQAGAFGFKVAQARPDKVKALVAVEPAVAGDITKAAALKNVPMLMVYRRLHRAGFALAEDPRQRRSDFAEAVRAAGGSVDVVDLPEAGIKGNSHMMMMDKNNGEVADLIQKWLVGKGLSD